ncbi:MAG: restriction endonuclease [Sandaracinaceae bacterium]|nr:restriction endonuclease [Sandaracinaceae bacterium]
MTFTEAAIEVLRLTGKPLHYKKITDIAIQKNLLSHVGKTPEVTMSSRLATLVKKDRGESLIIKVKPGVFGLRDFGQEVIAAAEAEIPDDPQAAAEEAALEVHVEETDDAAAVVDGGEAVEGAPAAAAVPAPKKASKPLPGSDVFPEEEDDDEPILSNLDKDDAKNADGGGREGRGGRGRRRRRRGGRPEGGDVRADERPPGAEHKAAERPARDDDRPAREPYRGGRDSHDRPSRDSHGGGRDSHERGAREYRDEMARGDANREHGDGELVGKELADAVYAVLAAGERQPQMFSRVAENLVRKGRLQGDANALIPTVAAAARADIARRDQEGVRSRFRIIGGRVALTDWSLPGEAVRFEQDAVRAADRQRDQVRSAFLRRVRELPGAGFAELLASWLNAEGVVSLRAVRRPGALPGELHLAGTLKRGHDETRLALIARRDSREISRERVIDVRGALHYYGNASAAWIITTGQVLSGAREESAVPGTAPVSLFDGIGMARAMERLGVGLRRHAIPVATLDLDFLDALRGVDANPAPSVSARDENASGGGGNGRDRDRGGRDRDRSRRDRDDKPKDENASATAPAQADGATNEAPQAPASDSGEVSQAPVSNDDERVQTAVGSEAPSHDQQMHADAADETPEADEVDFSTERDSDADDLDDDSE